MQEHFYEKYDSHEFKLIYDTIITYYPTGTSLSEVEYKNFSGLSKKNSIINENFFNRKNYEDKWVKFRKYLTKELKKPVEESMVAFYPCYSGSVILKRKRSTQYAQFKTLNFYISLLGPYYSIFGVDESEIELPYSEFPSNEKTDFLNYPAIHAITVSPYLEYEQPFLLLEKIIQKSFPGYRLIPHRIHQLKIPGTSYPSSIAREEGHDSIFSALFNPSTKFNAEVRGDDGYGFDDWLIRKN